MIISKEEYIAWIAGLYEGEGHSTKNDPITIAQKDTWILYKLQELYGGSIRPPSRTAVVSSWRLGSWEGRDLLKLLIPYLSPKRIRQIEDAGVFDVLRRDNTCHKGHELIGSNVYIYKVTGKRQCRLCMRNAQIERRSATSKTKIFANANHVLNQ